MAYAYITLTTAISLLAARLYDPNNQFWTSAELTSYIKEAIRTWNAYTGFHRTDMNVTLTANIWWYDLPAMPGSVRPHSVTDKDIIDQISYHLLEPLDAAYPLVWAGTTQFSYADILGAIERRQNETLGVTGCSLTRSLVTAPIISGAIVLSDPVIDIRRVMWIPTDHTYYHNTILRQSDQYAERSFDYSTYLSGTITPPLTWFQSTEQPISFNVDRIPPTAGQYELITVDAGSVPSTSSAAAMAVPDDWTWVVKFGALMDLMSRDSNAQDTLRSQYCQYRYKEGLAMLSTAPSVLSVRRTTIPMALDAVRSGDDFNPYWQALPASTPVRAYTAGLNLIGFGPKPDSSVSHIITLSLVQNAPIPATGASYLQIAKDDLDIVLDYAQHLAAFKLGGAEFTATIPLYQNFFKRATIYNSKLRAMGQYQILMHELSQSEMVRSSRLDHPLDSTSITREVINA